MAIGLFTGPIFYIIGTGDFLHSFFSTISYRLENNKWGSRFPVLMKELYNDDGINYEKSELALKELTVIKTELLNFLPEKIVWDIDDLSKQPPWGNTIAARITSLANYFITSDGKDIFEVFEKALNASIEIEEKLIIRSL